MPLNWGRRILSIPGTVGAVVRTTRKKLLRRGEFPGSQQYWIRRYEAGGNSGGGSRGRLAEFKAEVLNQLAKEQNIGTLIEFGCGDGHQLLLARYPSYLGFDVSPRAVSLCQALFAGDKTKSFRLMSEYGGEIAQLSLSLDVVFHLVEDNLYAAYMERLFDSAERFVIIYSSDTDENLADQAPHIKHRKFTAWIDRNQPQWRLVRRIPNRFPLGSDGREGSFADFYLYERTRTGGPAIPAECCRRPCPCVRPWTGRSAMARPPKSRLVQEGSAGPEAGVMVRSTMRVTIAIAHTPTPSETFIRGHIESLKADVLGPYIDRQELVFGDWQPEVLSLGRARPKPLVPMKIIRGLARRLLRGRHAPQWPTPLKILWKNYVVAHQPDIVLAEFAPAALCVMDWCEEQGVPFVTHFHGYDASTLLRQEAYRALWPKLFRSSASVIAVSTSMKQRLAAMGCPPGKIHVIPCGARVQEFPLSTYVSRQPCHFLWVARLVEVKGPIPTLKAFALCQAEVPECSLTMIGGGALYDKVSAWIHRQGLDGRIHLLGSQPHAVVCAYAQRCSAFVQHSRTSRAGEIEGWGISLAEAAAAGVPVVATRHGGIPDQVIEGQTGFLVDEGDWHAMGEKMILLAKDPALRQRLGRAAREHILHVGNFDLQIVKLRELLEAAVTDPASAGSQRLCTKPSH